MIEINHLSKKYGDHLAVDDLNLTIEPGRIYGLLGTNGAGKSTTMNIMTGYIGATSGQVKIDGHDILENPEEAKKCIGYLPENPPLYVDMTTEEYLTFVAELKKVKKAERKEQVERVMEQTGVLEMRNRLIRNLSKGYKQRVGLAQAILGTPKVIILDEPTVGLDPVQIIEIRKLIRSLGKDHTVILSSHILTEISEVCDYVYIISKGKLVASDTTENLVSNAEGGQVLEVVLQGDKEEITKVCDGLSGMKSYEIQEGTEKDTYVVTLQAEGKEDIRGAVSKSFATAGIAVFEMKVHRDTLEDVFLKITGEERVDEEPETEESSENLEEAEEEPIEISDEELEAEALAAGAELEETEEAEAEKTEEEEEETTDASDL